MSMFIALVLCVVAVSLSSVYAESDESGSSEDFEALISECLKMFDLTRKDLNGVVTAGDVSKMNSCFWGCYFKKNGLLNAEGQYDLDNYLTTMRKFRKDGFLASIEEMGRRCAPVKDEPVTDGEAGCERGALLAVCFVRFNV